MKPNFKRHLSVAFYCWLLVLASCLGACQRASYTFQRSAATAYQVLPPTPVVESEETATITSSRQRSIALPSKKRWFGRLGARRAAAQRVVLRVKMPLVPRRKLAGVARRVPNQVRRQQEPAPGAAPVRHRSRGIALLLVILSLTYLPLSLHNFYLGYYGRGALAIALLVVGICLVTIGFIGFLFGGAPSALGYIGFLMLVGWLGWQIVDLINIITGKLQPKNGEYNARFL
jgi:hypothetical protein